MNEVVDALEPVVDALEALGVRYRVGGSVASSALGVPRSTLDVDIACELDLGQVAQFVASLSDRYYIDGDMISDAIRRRASFNLVHLATMLKVDVFIRKGRAFDAQSFERVTRKPLDVAAGARSFDLTTAEDIILHKLEWYRMGDEISERQWLDVVGVLKVQARAIDLAYLRHWASALEVLDLLERALHEAA
jgi:D-ribose pyranose/furanose isomerase RbsD